VTPPTLTTERLVLRPLRLDDAPAVQQKFPQWEIVRFMTPSVPWPYPPGAAEAFLRDVLEKGARGERMSWAITERGQSELIGILEYFPGDNPVGNRGFWLDPAFWGRGYMTEAVTAMQDLLFFELGVEEIYMTNAVANTRSRAVKEKTGAEWVETFEHPNLDGGTESERWRMTASAWAAFRRG